ncbi:MAG TPA: efflux RND transporter periplasmic adaptor subunit [Acidobacteriota bacterium]|nr:efflux RND transporter periplasmic adaptor subunit [Acidobacteriota bacterium]
MKRTLAVIAVLAAAALAAADRTAGQDMPPTLVETDTVRTLEFHEQITLVGRTEARIESRIVAEISGQVAAIDAGEGTWIERGGVLMTIDPEPHRLELAAREADVTEAKVQVGLASSNWERTQELYQQKLVREISRDSAKAWLIIAEARQAKLGAQRDQLALNLDNCRIKAPFAGYTGRRLVDVGEWVIPGTPVFEMADLSRLTVVVSLPERHFGRLSLKSPATIVASGDESRPLIGTVTGFSPRASEETHAYPVIITVDNPEDRLGGGALVRATLSLDQMFTSLAVSKDAIVRQGPQTMIYTIHDGQAAPIPVMITSEQGATVAVAGEGLVQGMPVVVRGNERIFPGSPVRTAGGPPETESP